MPLPGNTRHSFYPGMRYVNIVPTPSLQFNNGTFDDGLVGYTVYNEWISPGGVIPGKKSTLMGCPIPADPTPYPMGEKGGVPTPSIGQSSTFTPSAVAPFTGTNGFLTRVMPNGPYGSYLELSLKGTMKLNNGGIAYGPAVISNSPVIAGVGDRISFSWTALGGGDAYNVLAYIFDPDQSCRYFIMVDDTGDNGAAVQPWTKVSKVIGPGEAGNYYFVFISGTFDYNFGTGTGAILGIDTIKIEKAGTY
jgi:hypothetical protein